MTTITEANKLAPRIFKNYTSLYSKSQKYCQRLLNKIHVKMPNIKIFRQNYHGSKKELQFECPKGHHFGRCPISIMNRDAFMCPICKVHLRHQKYYKNFKAYINHHYKGYKVLGMACRRGSYFAKMICPQGHIFTRPCKNEKLGKLCPTCKMALAGKNHKLLAYKKSKHVLKRRLNQNHLRLITILPTKRWKPLSRHYVILRCPYGHYTVRHVANLIHNYNCTVCLTHKRRYQYYLKFRKFFSHYYPGYLLIKAPIYLKRKSIVKLQCPRGHIYTCSANSVLLKCGCPACGASHGERLFRRLLLKYDVPFIYGDTRAFSHHTRLHLDFVIPNRCAVEIDGDFHFKPKLSRHRGDTRMQSLRMQQRSDNLKDKLCVKNKIPLMRIKYVEGTNRSKYIRRAFKWLLLHQFNLPVGITYLY